MKKLKVGDIVEWVKPLPTEPAGYSAYMGSIGVVIESEDRYIMVAWICKMAPSLCSGPWNKNRFRTIEHIA